MVGRGVSDEGTGTVGSETGGRRARRWAIAGLLVIVLTVTSVPVLGFVAYGPARTVSAYFDALERGDATAAVERLLLGEVTDGWALTDAALTGAPSLPTRVSVTHVEVDGDQATAHVRYDLAGTTRSQDVALVRRTGLWGLFPEWLIDPGELPRLDLVVDGASTLNLNSADVPVPREGLPVLYPVEYSAGFAEEWFRSDVQNAVVDGTAPEVEVRLAAEPTDRLLTEVQKLVREHLEECATATTLMPAGCTFGLDSVNEFQDDVQWEIVEYPEISLSSERRRLVTEPAEGTAHITGRYRDIVTAAKMDIDEDVPFTFTASVSVVDGQPRIEPLAASLSGDGTTDDGGNLGGQ